MYNDVTGRMRLMMIPVIRVELGKCLYDFVIIGIHRSRAVCHSTVDI